MIWQCMNQFVSRLVALVDSLMNGMSLQKNSGKGNRNKAPCPQNTRNCYISWSESTVHGSCMSFLFTWNQSLFQFNVGSQFNKTLRPELAKFELN